MIRMTMETTRMSRVCITAGSKDETPVRIRTSGDATGRADWAREKDSNESDRIFESR